MKIITCVLIPILVSCSAQTEKQKEPREVFIVNETHSDLSQVVARLVDEPVEGYVLIHHSATEYPSVAKARQDTCAPKSIVRFETERLHLHTPLAEKDDDHYNWGSPLVFRQVIIDHGDVVEVNTMDQDLLTNFQKEPIHFKFPQRARREHRENSVLLCVLCVSAVKCYGL